MDKIAKFLNKLNKKQREKIQELILKILANDISEFKVKKLKGFEDLYRIREGQIRMVFRKKDGKNILININFRKDIYKK